MYDYLIVGAGLTGATFAWHARQAGKSVLVIDKRGHVGGNCHSYQLHGIEVHSHGPHVFNTSDEAAWEYANRFANFRQYTHKVVDRCFSLPINLQTMNQLWGVSCPREAHDRLRTAQLQYPTPGNFEEQALASVGTELYQLLIRDYTCKQWMRDPKQLPASIARRLPVRLTWDDRYHDSAYSGIPVGGYTRWIQAMLQGCEVVLGAGYLSDRAGWDARATRTVYTGPIDALYDHCLGHLEYRTLQFDTQLLQVHDYQGVAQVNYVGPEVPWTRVTEHKHLDSDITKALPHTVITYETPIAWSEGAEPMYPINDESNQRLYARYHAMVELEPRLIVAGRMGTYCYLDMDKAILQAMQLAKEGGLT